MERDKARNRTKDDVVEELSRNKVVEEIILNVAGEMGFDEKDLAQDIYLDLLNKDEDKLINMSTKELRYYLARIVVNNICSKTSPFYYKYKKNTHYTTIDEIKDVI